ncbi:AAA family ATPase [Silvibacterium sp.]|uniref:AAA family ATPase n=1 Tax=Silvibacterium sp. TaxID=1964179 RepID=UPI0039E39E98
MIPFLPSTRLLEFRTSGADSVLLDVDNQCLWHAEQVVELTPKAFQLLHYLAMHPRKLISQGQITQHLWPNIFVNPNNLKKYILEARKALGDDARQSRYIETIPRRGYRLLATVHALNTGAREAKLNRAPNRTRAFVGREQEMEFLRHLYGRARDGERQLVFLTGPAGIGKSAVAAAFLEWLKQNSPEARLCTVNCFRSLHAEETVKPLVSMLEDLCEHDPSGATAQCIEEYAPTWIHELSPYLTRRPSSPAPPERAATVSHIVSEVVRAMDHLSANQPMVLVLDDLQWSDYSTFNFLNAMARRVAPAKLLILALFRPTRPDASDAPIRVLKHDLICHDLCQHISLQPLSRDEVKSYLSAAADSSALSEAAIDRFHMLSGGTPFVMRALSDEQDMLTAFPQGADAGAGHPGEALLCLPRKVEQFLEVELATLSPADLSILEACSIVREPFGAMEIGAALGQEATAVQDTLARFARAGEILRRSRTKSSSCEFQLEFYREGIYARIPPERREQMHRRLAVWLEEHSALLDPEIGERVAHHFEEAKEWKRAVPYVLLSSDEEDRTPALGHAIRLLYKERA